MRGAFVCYTQIIFLFDCLVFDRVCCCDKWMNREEEKSCVRRKSSSGMKLFKLSFMCNVSTIYQDFRLLLPRYLRCCIEWDYLMMSIWMHKELRKHLGKSWNEVKAQINKCMARERVEMGKKLSSFVWLSNNGFIVAIWIWKMCSKAASES